MIFICSGSALAATALIIQPLPASDDRLQLRRQLRARRSAIQGSARRCAALLLARRVDLGRWLRPGLRIGLYLPTAEEIDTAPLLSLARRRGCHIALPRVISRRADRMAFFDFAGAVRTGAFGIREPRGGRRRAARELDIVFMPLVGFDSDGNRIGMGRGFFDRHFAHRLHPRRWRRPLLVGLAYEAQRVTALPRSTHDVPVDAIVTEYSTRRFDRRPA